MLERSEQEMQIVGLRLRAGPRADPDGAAFRPSPQVRACHSPSRPLNSSTPSPRLSRNTLTR